MVGVCASVVGCASELRPVGPTRDDRPRDALERAVALGKARAWSLYHVATSRWCNAHRALRTVDGVAPLLDRADLDLRSDVDRALAATIDVQGYRSVIVLEHALSEARIARAFRSWAKGRGRPRRLAHAFPAVEARFGAIRRIVAAPEPNLLVMVPAGDDPSALVGSGGLPVPEDGEAIAMYGTRPHRSVDHLFPDVIEEATIVCSADSTGGVEVAFTGWSADSRRAKAAAKRFERNVEEKTQVDLLLGKLTVLGPFHFRAEGRRVRCNTYLTKTELDWCVGMALLATGGR